MRRSVLNALLLSYFALRGAFTIRNLFAIFFFFYLSLAFIACSGGSQSGTNSAGDKIVEPNQSIQSAIDGASSGQTVWVKSGTWILNSQLRMKKGVNVKAYPGMEAYDWETDTINPTHPYIIPGTCDHCGIRWGLNQGNNEFSGFEVAGGHSGIDIHADNVIVTNNWIHDTDYTSILIASASNILVEHNKTERDGQHC